VAAHDLNHTVQAERALMQPFIAGSGPWRTAGVFADHDLGEAASWLPGNMRPVEAGHRVALKYVKR
jgi:hypothetical protein